MRVTAKPSRSTRDIEIDVGSLAPPAASPVDARPAAPSAPPAPSAPTAPTARPTASVARANQANRARLPIVAACVFLAVVAAGAIPAAVLVLGDSQDGGAAPTETIDATEATEATDTAPTSTPTTSPPVPGEESGDESGSPSWVGVAGAVAAVLLAVLLAAVLVTRRVRRRALRRGTLRTPGDGVFLTEGAVGDAAAGRATADRPGASLGTPDVLILTESASEGDVRLRERVRDQEQAIFANLQLACSFYPTEDWVFSSARLTVVLARVDGRAAPAPIAYSLRPLSDRDGSAREQNVEIGADMKFVSVKGGERSTAPGEEFVRGYGLQESVSYWEFTATRHQPLQGSFVLWLIARAPRESDLMITSTLQVRVTPRSGWSRAQGPSVAGKGEVSLLLTLKDGPPYLAQLDPAAAGSGAEPWLVDVL